ncbi:MAG: GH25 family lysozyme [Kangiellaceae bacterium]|nr:GH25 family lysozyme [Kangiellaceae bacterium]
MFNTTTVQSLLNGYQDQWGGFNGVVNFSSEDKNVNFDALEKAGIKAIIHRATLGANFTDPEYEPRRQEALKRGFLWGAYLSGTKYDLDKQLDYFFSVSPPDNSTLQFISWEMYNWFEDNGMDLDQYKQLVKEFKNKVGRWPLLRTDDVLKTYASFDPLLSKCTRLMYISYDSVYGPYAPGPWNWPNIWQYTNGKGWGPQPQTIPGMGGAERCRFYYDTTFNTGTEAQLYKWWKP